MSLLIIERGPGAGRRLPLTTFPVTIGRDETNMVVVADDEVSRFHLRIKKRGRLFIAEDLESRNGTFINGDRILNSIVQNGDKILVGSTEFQFLTSEPDIQIATEIMNFDMIVADELGLKGPIDLGFSEPDRNHTPSRLNQDNIADQLTHDIQAIREVYELHSNILVTEDLEEAARVLLKSINKVMPHASRAALFTWISATRQLIPIVTRHYKRKKESFALSQRSMEDVITRKQGVILQFEKSEKSSQIRNRLILPMTHNQESICILHIENDDGRFPFTPTEIEIVQALLARCAPIFDSMLLRRELDAWMVGMIETMIATIEAKDTYTHGHSERVSRYSIAIADELRLNREIRRLLLVSALCHDIGKVGIPDAILKKASMLSAEEYAEMKLHPTIGAEIISHMPNAHRFLSGVKHHHEKWDGSGYPDGLAGEEIPFFGRIVAIADVFDAMVSGRAYSGFMDQGDAIERIVDEKELFDPEILKACIRAYEKGTLTLKTSTAGHGHPSGLDPVHQNPPSKKSSPLEDLKSSRITKPSRHPKTTKNKK